MPNRILKESICESRDLSLCSIFAQDLYKRLITYADDYGRFNADPQIMIARLYPREMAVVTVDDITDGLVELTGVGKIGFYTSSPRHEVYGAFPNWSEHQRVRDSKKKNPEPTDTAVNDWYYRRFIPMDMKVEIIKRDECTCQICGQKISTEEDAKKLVKMGTGLFHFDHIVPCNQGGRATLENLRLTCPKCNLSRKKSVTFDEVLSFAESSGNSPKIAEISRKVPPNPIQSESLSEYESESYSLSEDDAHEIQKEQNRVIEAAENAGFQKSVSVRSRLIALYADSGLQKMLDGIESCVRHGAPNLAYLEAVLRGSPKKAKPKVNAQDYEQRDYSDVQKEVMDEQIREMEEWMSGG